jgi:hypothetical protein
MTYGYNTVVAFSNQLCGTRVSISTVRCGCRPLESVTKTKKSQTHSSQLALTTHPRFDRTIDRHAAYKLHLFCPSTLYGSSTNGAA